MAHRCDIVGGDFFQSVPSGADAYLLKGVLHSHDDEDAVEILQRICAAMRPDGRLLVVDVVLQELNEPNPQKALMDLMMLALTQGHERTEAQLQALLERAGFRLLRVITTDNQHAIVEGQPI